MKGYQPYSKPLYVLTDFRCASCGDWFPGVIKSNDRGITIGSNTMGAGGHVANIGIFPNSGASLNNTYSVWELSNGDIIEDRGTEPKHVVRMDQSDYRTGYKTTSGYRDNVLKIVTGDLIGKVLRPKIEADRKKLDELEKAITPKS